MRFVRGTGFDVNKESHIHNGEITVRRHETLSAIWTPGADGKAQSAHTSVSLTREE
jgi:hypothetical protein